MSILPLYEDAVSGRHWLDLAAPYVDVRCYSTLCRVSRRFYSQFAPRLWNDPLQAARRLGLHPSDDLQWLNSFIARHAPGVRLSTRRLVASLDFGVLAVDAPALSLTAGPSGSGQSLTELLRRASVLFPAVRCILLSGKSSYDPVDLGRLVPADAYPEDGAVPMPLMLDMSCCGLPLPSTFFHLSYWRQLVFLDMSDLPGSLQGIIKTGTLGHSGGGGGALPHLRILKLRGRGLTDASLAPITDFAQGRVWSLDLSRNKLTDACVHALLVPCFGPDDLTADCAASSRAEVQGRLLHSSNIAGAVLPPVWHGWLSYIDESPSSVAFAHPDRHLADAPAYDVRRPSRLAGHEPLQSDKDSHSDSDGDSAQSIKTALAGGFSRPIPDWHDAREAGICKSPPSLTHLHLSANPGITIEGVEALFRRCRGHLRLFDCASPPRLLDRGLSRTLGSGCQVAGVLGRSHLFRPVFASNLQSLRVHHSLVTRVPAAWLDGNGDADADGDVDVLATLHYAETALRARVELAYPQAFVPDMNPRLQSLTLTGLPRVSSGPVIVGLIQFLLAAAEQEAAIRSTAASRSRRSPTLLRGLRHVRFEFDPWPRSRDDRDAARALGNLDARALLDAGGGDDFSFFNRDASVKQGSPVVSVTGPAASIRNVSPLASSESERGLPDRPADRLPHYPLPAALSADSEYVRATVSLGPMDDGRAQTVAVWVGSGYADRHSSSPAVAAYMANLSQPLLRANVRPATPDQVQAGVPAGVCVYNRAWDAIVWMGMGMGGSLPRRPATAMRDVAEAIRQFRRMTKAECPARRHWMGRLEMMFS